MLCMYLWLKYKIFLKILLFTSFLVLVWLTVAFSTGMFHTVAAFFSFLSSSNSSIPLSVRFIMLTLYKIIMLPFLIKRDNMLELANASHKTKQNKLISTCNILTWNLLHKQLCFYFPFHSKISVEAVKLCLQ